MRHTPPARKRYTYVGRVRRLEVAGEPAGIELAILGPGDVAELVGGDEFVTLETVVDLFDPPPRGDR